MEAQATVASRKGKEFLLSECYVSVQGESSLVGLPTIFVRLYTCNLRCRWCDSMHAVEGGDFTRMGVDATVKKILRLAGDLQSDARGIRNLCWTGGGPSSSLPRRQRTRSRMDWTPDSSRRGSSTSACPFGSSSSCTS